MKLINKKQGLFPSKKAFTLAEVLVTLAVIGIVAALTIPGLIGSYRAKAIRTQWKKTFSVINSVASSIRAEHGAIDGSCGSGINDPRDLFIGYLSVAKVTASWHTMYYPDHNVIPLHTVVTNGMKMINSGLPSIYLTDGTIMGVSWNNGVTCQTVVAAGDANVCFYVIADVNGLKGPNVYGRDIFAAYVTEDKGVIPAGSSVVGQSTTCATETYEGSVKCSAVILGAEDIAGKEYMFDDFF